MRTVAGFLFGLFAGALLLAGTLSTWQRTGTPPLPAASPVTAPDVSRSASTARTEAGTGEFFLGARLRQGYGGQARLRQGSGGQGRGHDNAAWEEIFVVENGIARSVPLPESVDRSVLPVTDGTRVYAYVEGSTQQAAGGRRLVAFTLDGREDETITGSTPLVEPRGLFAAPNGAFLAFFLDNRQSLATELWTYDTSARTKRVSVERLTKDELHGPYFSSDGSFLLHLGTQILAGSPRRTGAEVLSVALPLHEVRWTGNIARSPEGERIAVVTEVGDEQTTITRVAEYVRNSSRSLTRFSLVGDSVRILGWFEPDSLLLVSDTEHPTVWMLRGDSKISRVLGPGASALSVSDDGLSVGFLRQEQDSVRIETLDVATGRLRVVGAMAPRPLSVVASPAPELGPPSSEFLLLQNLRVAASHVAVPVRAPLLDPELLLRYISGNIRTLADAPAAEPVTAERVWLTTAPDMVYVDYRVGTMLWRRLVRVEVRRGTPVGSVVGIFAPISGEWALARGDDMTDRTPVRLYEFEPDLGAWVEKPLAAGAFP